MEIYNEEINDLLAPENRKLQVHENIEVCLSSCSIFYQLRLSGDPPFTHCVMHAVMYSAITI